MGTPKIAKHALPAAALVALIALSSPTESRADLDAGAYLGGIAAQRLGDPAAASEFLAEATAADPFDQTLAERALIADQREGEMGRAMQRAKQLAEMGARNRLSPSL